VVSSIHLRENDFLQQKVRSVIAICQLSFTYRITIEEITILDTGEGVSLNNLL